MNAENMTLDSLVRRGASSFPDKLAIHDADRSLTYGQLDADVDGLAAALLELGVRKGDRVASLFFNEWQAFVVYFAVVRLGALIVPINHRLVGAEVAFQLSQADCAVLVYCDELEAVVAPLRGAVPVKHWIASGAAAPDAGEHRLEALLDDYRGRRPALTWTVRRGDASGVWFTSGTTGEPKGTVTTHDSGIWAATCMALALGMTEQHRLLGVAPAFHRGPMENFHVAGFLLGSSHYLLRRFDPVAMLRAIEEHRLTHGFIVPSMTYAVLGVPDRADFDLSSMRGWLTASAHFPEEYRCRLETETTLPSNTVFNAYGITESLLNTCLWPSEAPARPGSVGRTVPGVWLRIVDAERRTLAAGEVGEIAVSAPSIASTYLGRPESWAAVTFVDDGRLWYLSGDLGRLDDEGYLYIVDRAKDMVISGGENIYSAEVEQVLINHPGVHEVAVVGAPDERWGECVVAVVVRSPGAQVGDTDLVEFCDGRLASYKRPRRIHFVDTLPRNGFGKVQKQRVRTLVAELPPVPHQ
ncbi:class I adenylate-forming enzyme family protein [Pseudonocardia xishanensis]|uniref:Long-chain fatty acid--CoA ligase n=1 Tax=Pseudonocardia xishanensis TaxID=630995 RepID=A0ABP8RI57_9PSEU